MLAAYRWIFAVAFAALVTSGVVLIFLVAGGASGYAEVAAVISIAFFGVITGVAKIWHDDYDAAPGQSPTQPQDSDQPTNVQQGPWS